MQNNKLFRAVSQSISFLFNPLMIPSLGILFIFLSGSFSIIYTPKGMRIILLIVFTGTLLLPLIMFQILQYFELISNIQMEKRKERIIPYSITLIFFILTWFYLNKLPVPFINKFILASVLCLIVNIIILFFWKISSHSIGAGGLVACMLYTVIAWHSVNYIFLLLSIFIAGLVGSSRLYLGVHTEKEVYLGFLTGFVVVFLSLLL
jgi:membrane-associated phospholipid phosphatase